MEVLKALQRTVTVAEHPFTLSVDKVTGRCSVVVVKASYRSFTFKQHFRPEDLLLPTGQSMLFLKLILQEFDFTENSIRFVSDISLDNAVLGKRAQDTFKTLPAQYNESTKGVLVLLNYDRYIFGLQLPALATRQTFHPLPQQFQTELFSALQCSQHEMMAELERSFIAGEL